MRSQVLKRIGISAAFLLSATHVFAADGTINFTGNISSNTCIINSGASTINVAFGSVPATSLSASGQTAGEQDFSMVLTGCSGGTSVAARFEGLTGVTSAGYITLSSVGAAQNVAIAIYDNSGTLQPVDGTIPNTSYVAISSGAATLNYRAAYIATGTASAGTGNASVNYTLYYK